MYVGWLGIAPRPSDLWPGGEWRMANGEWPIGLSMVLPDGPWPMACAVLAVLERYAALRCLSLARGTVGR
eukprot:915216-Prymnesium_polylepis.1